MVLTKAFDLLNHAKVLELCHKCGITGEIGQVIQNWLTDRTQFIECGNKKSQTVRVNKSCIQGSVLGPTLWLIYIQSLMDRLQGEYEFFAYADDIAIAMKIVTKEDQEKFEKILRILQEWAQDYGMQWSSAKTQRLVFKYINCREPHPPRAITFGGDQILPMKTSVSLGIVFNAECIFYAQIKKVEDFINMMTSQIKKYVKNRSKELLKKSTTPTCSQRSPTVAKYGTQALKNT